MAKAFITASGTWPGVATDGSPITVECIGGGGGGHPGDFNIGTGGGGGAYAVKTVAYVSGASVTVVVGAAGVGGASPADGGDTDFDSGVVIAKGGQAGQGGAGGGGGAGASCTPSTGAFSGGDGGGIGGNSRAGAGGGGAAGPNGDGQDGGVGGASSPFNGAGGGGAGGGSSTPGGASTNSDPSGAGGDAQDGTAGGAGVNAGAGDGNPGSNGSGGSGGGGGGAGTPGVGGLGGDGIEFDATHGAGGGAGGGGGTGGAGGAAGNYGGGGGGGAWSSVNNGGAGGQGLIVITYTPGGSTITLTPGAGSITLTPGTPVVSLTSITLSPGAAALALTPGTPVVSFSGTGFITLSPGAGSLTFTGGTPTLSLSGNFDLAPGAGSIALTGGTPGVFLGTGVDLHPTPGSLTFTGGTPTVTVSLSPGAGSIAFTTTAPGVSLVRTVGSGNQLFIGDVSWRWRESSFHITKTLSGEWSASFDLDYYGVNRPVADMEVAMFWDSVKRFGGLVQSVKEVGIPGLSSQQSILRVRVSGYQSLFDRVIYTKLVTTALGPITGEIVYNFWYDKLRQFGISKIGDSPLTLTPEILFHYITGTEVMNRVREFDPGYDYWIDDNKLLHYELTAPLVASAPFTIRDGDANSDRMEVETSNTRFRNRQFVLPTADLFALRTDSHTVAASGETSFSTDYNLDSKPIVKVGDGITQVEQLVTEQGNWVTGWQYYYVPGGPGVFAATAPGIGDVVDISYPSPYPLAEMAEDAASIAAVGPYEAVWQARSVYDRDTARAMAEGFIELFADGGYIVEMDLEYNSESQPDWLEPGMVLDVDHIFPTALGLFTVEQVESQEESLRIWRHSIKLRSGLGEVTDSQAIQQSRVSARVPIDSPPYRLPWSLFEDINGLTNPGAAVGAIKQTQTIMCSGVITSWAMIFPDDPPTGDDFIMDVKVNGVSIMPTADADKVFVGDGDTTLRTGIRFLTDNIQVRFGDKVTLEVLQVGSDFGGANATFYLNIKVPANPGQQ